MHLPRMASRSARPPLPPSSNRRLEASLPGALKRSLTRRCLMWRLMTGAGFAGAGGCKWGMLSPVDCTHTGRYFLPVCHLSAFVSLNQGLQTMISAFSNRKTSSLSVVVVGASGDLAKKKIFPALFALYYEGLLPKVY